MNTSLPLVSVRIVCYNQKDFIKEAIDSVLEQDYPNIEIIIADDCSTDGTVDILLEYQKKYPEKIVLALSDKNKGITKNINSGLRLCKGKYIAGLGGDDLMLHGKIRKQVEYMENHPECTICYHNLDVFNSNTNKTLYFFNEKVHYEGAAEVLIKYGTFNGACSNMVRASKIPQNGFNNALPVAADWLFWCECLLNGGEIHYIDEILGRYRRHNNNITKKVMNTINNATLDHLNTANILLAKYPEYSNNVFYRLSNMYKGLRFDIDYKDALKVSLGYRLNLKAFAGLILYILTFSKVKL